MMAQETPTNAKSMLSIDFLCNGRPAPPPSDIKPVWSDAKFCSICLKTYSSKGNLRVHYNIVHKARRDFACNQCDKSFGTKNNLHRHVIMVHRKERPFMCQYCDRRFTTRSCVKRHESTHERRSPASGASGER